MVDSTEEKLEKIRNAKKLSLKPSKFLREFVDIGGELRPLSLRHYQIQMVMHLLMKTRFIVGDGAGLGKTLETITALCYMWEKEPDMRVMIVTDTSAMRQWGGEFDRFTDGIDWMLVEGTSKKRVQIYEKYFNEWDDEKPSVLITNYPRLRNDRRLIQEHLQGINYTLILDEITAVKTPDSRTHHAVKELALDASRCYGLTATLIKNNLVEGFGIYGVVVPELFPDQRRFQKEYCLVARQPVPSKKGGKVVFGPDGKLLQGRFIEVIKGHTKEHIKRFREKIKPYYLGRASHEVSNELPVLTTKEVTIPLTHSQWLCYKEALSGLLLVQEGTEEEEIKETTKLTQLIYCQEIVDSPYIIGRDIKSAKEDALLNMLSSELENEKVIIFTRFRSVVDRIQDLLEAKGWELGIESSGGKDWVPKDTIKNPKKGFVRITGSEDSSMRDAARRSFTEKEDTSVIFVTMAGAQAINLQQARVMVFFDLPWSAGDYIQLVGRMIRIGSPHQRVMAVHMLGEGPDNKPTIDHYVNDTLIKKMGWIEGALGKRLVQDEGDDTDIEFFDTKNVANDLFQKLIESAKGLQ